MRMFTFECDADTQRFFEIVAYFLRHYFSYTPNEAIALINQYYFDHSHIEDADFFHHIGCFQITLRIHYFSGLQNEYDGVAFHNWKIKNGYNKTPHEALEYFRRSYFRDD